MRFLYFISQIITRQANRYDSLGALEPPLQDTLEKSTYIKKGENTETG
jgi:hypothetical protein